jgi:hypothetical protein
VCWVLLRARQTREEGRIQQNFFINFILSTRPQLLLLSSDQSRVQDIEMLVGDPRDVLTDCARREGHVVRDGDRDPRIRVDRGGGGVLDEIDERGGGDGVWKQEGGEANGEREGKTEERRQRERRTDLAR